MSKEKAIKYIKAAQTAIDEAPYPCTTKAKLLLAEALKELGFGISLLYKGEHGVYVTWR